MSMVQPAVGEVPLEGARAGGAAAPARLVAGTTDVIRSEAGFSALVPEWAALEREAGGAALFQSAAWAGAVFDFEAGRANRGFEPVIVTLRENGRLVGVLPLERVRSGFRTLLVPLGNTFPQYSDVLLAPRTPPDKAVSGMLRAALGAARADLVLFLKVRADSALASGMPKTSVSTGAQEAAPFVDLGAHVDFAGYFSTIKAKTRKNMRNARNRLERDAPLSHAVAETEAEVLGVIARTLEGRAERLKDQGLTSRAFGSGAFHDFCQALARQPGIDLLAMSLRHGERPIAEQWGLVHGGRYYAYVASRDFAQSEESPGKLHLGEVIETCFARGLRVADLLVPSMPYKMTWASGETAVADHAIPATIKGWAAVHLWDRRLRPAVKRAVLGLDPGLRARLMSLVSRG